MCSEDRDLILKYVVDHRSSTGLFTDFKGLYSAFSWYTDREIIDVLGLWETQGYLRNDYALEGITSSRALPKSIQYHDDKCEAEQVKSKAKAVAMKEKRRIERNDWIKFYVPVVLSGIAIILSVLAFLVSINVLEPLPTRRPKTQAISQSAPY